jgi:penicillin G amidase
MRKVLFSLLVAGTILWLYFTCYHLKGINSIQGLANYHNGLLSKMGLDDKESLKVVNSVAGATVYIDSLGIPDIFGKDAESAAFAIGYMHARDRYFQMELLTYSVMGRLSEIIGEPGIESDMNWKRFGLEEKAKEMFDSMAVVQPDLVSYLEAYSRGVDDYIEHEGNNSRDPMFCIWNSDPKPWKPYYTFLIQWYMSADLTLFDDYIDRQEILDKVPESIRNVLYPMAPPERVAILGIRKGYKLRKPVDRSTAAAFTNGQVNRYHTTAVNSSLGSNNWVVGSRLTSHGQSFLCNDLHLFLASPNIFYEMQINSPAGHWYGFTIPGVPLVLTGHNEKIAWGITSGGWDVTEQYLLKLDSTNQDRYWLDGRSTEMKEKKFVIQVKDKAPVSFVTKYTTFGPLVKKDSFVYALRWHPQFSAFAVQSFWKIMHAESWTEFREALRRYDYPCQNFVYADVKGNQGLMAVGKMPVKPQDYAGGMLNGAISPITDYIPFDSMPQIFNPAQNFLYSANQEPEVSSYYFSSRWFDDIYRPQRIRELLSGNKKLEWEDMRQMQLDITDLSVQDIKRLVHKYHPDTVAGGEWRSILNWDGKLTPYDKETLFYKAFRRAARMVSRGIAAKIRVKTPPYYDQFINFLLNFDSVVLGDETLYGKDLFHDLEKKTDSIFIAVFGSAEKDHSRNGPFSIDIPQMTFLPGLDIYVPDVGGNENTIDVNYEAHPVVRTIIEISDSTIESWMINALGQTGRINERNYAQQLASWRLNVPHKSQFTNDPQALRSITQKIEFGSNKN